MQQESVPYKVEYPQQGITIYSGPAENPTLFSRGTDTMFEALGFLLMLIPVLWITSSYLRDKSDEQRASAIVRQGVAEADRQSELRRKREAELKKSP